jgi:hypothetical protein
MEYNSFVNAMISKIEEVLSPEVKIQKQPAIKNNGRERIGLVFRVSGINIAPSIYLEEYYRRFCSGEDLDSLAEDIIRFYRTVRVEKNFDDAELVKFEGVREKIIYQLVNYEMNRESLENRPYFRVYDLAAAFYVLLDVKEQGMITFAVDNSHMELWNITERELYQCAMENTPRLLEASFGCIDDVIREIQACFSLEKEEDLEEHEEGNNDMYILSNHVKNRGASAILYPHILEMIGEMLKSDYYILPSSIHEVIILPAGVGIQKSDLVQMVREINTTQVEEEEVLSQNVYYFDRKLKSILY